MIEVIKRKTAPLCFLPDGSLISYHLGKVLTLRDGMAEKSVSVPISVSERIFGRSRYLTRLLRFGVRSAEALDEECVILSIGNKLFELNLKTQILSDGWACGQGIRPLKMTAVKDINSFADGVYFGGYLVNMEKDPVHIYRRLATDNWEVVYSFPQGSINHVHCIVADQYRQCLWVFTGDFEEAAAIWRVTDNFRKVERIVCNDQKYRGCVVYALPEGLLYATDAPYAENFIYLFDPKSLETKPLFPMHGSCIYGCQWKSDYVFSSSVECDVRNMTAWQKAFSRKIAAGIKDNFVHLYKGNVLNGFREIYREEKDAMSFLFQFGVFKFPAGQNRSDTLYFQPMSTKKNDLRLMAIID